MSRDGALSWLIGPVVASLASGVVVLLGWRLRPPPRRALDSLVGRSVRSEATPSGHASVVAKTARAMTRFVSFVGRVARRALGLAPDPSLDRRVGFALVSGSVAGLVSAPAAIPVGAAIWGAPWLVARTREKRRADRVLDELPEVVDLLRLALGSGSSLRLAVATIAPRCGPIVGARLRNVDRQLDRGVPLGEALRQLEALGEPFRPVLQALSASERHGAPIVPVLDRIAGDTRTARRRRAEERARRVPVKLLFPLVFCTLPAFGLLTVVPLLASALGRMSL